MYNEILRLSAVLTTTKMGRSRLDAELAVEGFPFPLRRGVRAVSRKRSEVRAWLEIRQRRAL